MGVQRLDYPPGGGPITLNHADNLFPKDAPSLPTSSAVLNDGTSAKFSEVIGGPSTLALRDGISTKLTDLPTVSTGTVAEPDTIHVRDPFVTLIAPAIFQDNMTMKSVKTTDIFNVTSGTITFIDATRTLITDTFFGVVNNWRVDHSGTPDTDAFGDSWTNGNPLNKGDNHGNDALLHISNLAVGAQVGFFEADLTRFANLSAPTTGTLIFSFVSNSDTVAVNYTFHFSSFASRPFTESTITFNNEPSDGGNIVTKTLAIAGMAATQRYTITLVNTEYGPYLGNWLMIRVTNDDATLGTDITSREGTTTTDRPNLSFNFQR